MQVPWRWESSNRVAFSGNNFSVSVESAERYRICYFIKLSCKSYQLRSLSFSHGSALKITRANKHSPAKLAICRLISSVQEKNYIYLMQFEQTVLPVLHVINRLPSPTPVDRSPPILKRQIFSGWQRSPDSSMAALLQALPLPSAARRSRLDLPRPHFRLCSSHFVFPLIPLPELLPPARRRGPRNSSSTSWGPIPSGPDASVFSLF